MTSPASSDDRPALTTMPATTTTTTTTTTTRRHRQRQHRPQQSSSSWSLLPKKTKSQCDTSASETYMARLGPLARSLSKGVLKDVTLEKVLDGKTCSPIALSDFLDFTTHKEVSSENLLFLVWFQSYRARFAALEEKERARVARPDRKLDQQRDPFGYLVVQGSETVTTLGGGDSEAGHSIVTTTASHYPHVAVGLEPLMEHEHLEENHQHRQQHPQSQAPSHLRAPQSPGHQEGQDDADQDANDTRERQESFRFPSSSSTPGISPWATIDPFSASARAASSPYEFPAVRNEHGEQTTPPATPGPQQIASFDYAFPAQTAASRSAPRPAHGVGGGGGGGGGNRQRLSSTDDDPLSSVPSCRQYSADSMTPLRPFLSSSSSLAVPPPALAAASNNSGAPPMPGAGLGRRLSLLAGSILSGTGRSAFSASGSASASAAERRRKYVPAVAPADQPMRLEAQRAFDNFLKRGSTLELNVEEELRSNCALALADSTHPDVFLPIYHDVFSLVEKQSLPHFLSYAQSNINWPKQLFWYAVGAADLALSLLVFLLLLFLVPGNATSTRSVAAAVGHRAYRLFSLPFALFGSMQLYSAWRGFCTQVWGRQNRQLHVWETPSPSSNDVEAGGRGSSSGEGVGTTSNHSDVTAIAPFAEPDPKDVWNLPEPNEKIERSPTATSPKAINEKQHQASQSSPAMRSEWDRMIPGCVMSFDLRDGLNLPRGGGGDGGGTRPPSVKDEPAEKPAIFGPEVAIVDDRVIQLHKQVVRDILIVGAAWSAIWVAICLAIP